MLIGYARTSTVEQGAGLEAQERDLRATGVKEIFSEQASSIAERPQLEAAMCHCRKGDILVVTKIDRLARSISQLVQIIDRLKARGVGLKILNLGLDTSSPTGELILNVLGCVAQFERAIMLERQAEGIKKARAEGKYTGRKATARNKTKAILALRSEGKSGAAIAEELKISPRSVWRVIAAAEQRQ